MQIRTKVLSATTVGLHTGTYMLESRKSTEIFCLSYVDPSPVLNGHWPVSQAGRNLHTPRSGELSAN